MANWPRICNKGNSDAAIKAAIGGNEMIIFRKQKTWTCAKIMRHIIRSLCTAFIMYGPFSSRDCLTYIKVKFAKVHWDWSRFHLVFHFNIAFNLTPTVIFPCFIIFSTYKGSFLETFSQVFCLLKGFSCHLFTYMVSFLTTYMTYRNDLSRKICTQNYILFYHVQFLYMHV